MKLKRFAEQKIMAEDYAKREMDYFKDVNLPNDLRKLRNLSIRQAYLSAYFQAQLDILDSEGGK